MRVWKTFKVAELTREHILVVGDGYRAKNVELSNEGFPFARGANINQGVHLDDAECLDSANLHRAGEKISVPGDVVFTSKGSVGRFAFVTESTPKFVYSPQLCYWRVLNTRVIDPGFLYFWMHGREFLEQSNGVKGQTDMADYVSLVNQRRFQVTLPPIEEQKAIAKILSSLDDKIELNRRMNATLEAMARALFKAWFVDFEPVHANTENRPSTSASPEIAKVFPSEFENGIPKGWSKARLGDEIHVFDFVANGSFESLRNNVQTYDEPNYALYLRTTDYNSGFNSSLKYLDKSSYEFLSKSQLLGTETIISNIGNVGTIFRPPNWLGLPMALGSNAVGLRSDLPSYVFRYFESYFGQHQLHSITTGSAQPKFNKTNLRDLQILIPSEDVGMVFNDFESAILRKENANKKESRQIAELRDSLLPRLISGKIRI